MTAEEQVISILLDRTEKIEAMLAEKLEAFAAEDFNGFVNFLYRLDISEEKVKEAFDTLTGKSSFIKISALIIEREREKQRTRALYSQQQKKDTEG